MFRSINFGTRWKTGFRRKGYLPKDATLVLTLI